MSASLDQNANSGSIMGIASSNSAAVASVPPPPPLEWVKPPQQARSQKTFERILDAAEEVIATQGLPALTIADVVKRANSSVGAFYSRFPDKEALVRTLHERSCEEALATAELALDPSRWRSVPLTEALTQVVSFVVQLFHQRRGLVLAFSHAVATDIRYAERRAEMSREISQLLYQFLELRHGEVRHSDLKTAASFGVVLLMGTLEQETIIQRVRDSSSPSPELAQELARALLGYLGVPALKGVD